MNESVYIIALMLLIGAAALFWWMALTVPMVAADGPALIAIFLTVCSFLLWRQHRRT